MHDYWYLTGVVVPTSFCACHYTAVYFRCSDMVSMLTVSDMYGLLNKVYFGSTCTTFRLTFPFTNYMQVIALALSLILFLL